MYYFWEHRGHSVKDVGEVAELTCPLSLNFINLKTNALKG